MLSTNEKTERPAYFRGDLYHRRRESGRKLPLISWNANRTQEAMQSLKKSGFDMALLQEAPLPESSWKRWNCDRGATMLQLTKHVEVHVLQSIPPGRRPQLDEITTSAPGTIAAGHIRPDSGKPFIAVSLYARWEMPNPCTPKTWAMGYFDTMAHRAISDLSTFIGHKDPATHRILISGDFNLIHGATEQDRLALPERGRSGVSRGSKRSGLRSSVRNTRMADRPNQPPDGLARTPETCRPTIRRARNPARPPTSSITYSRRGVSMRRCRQRRSMNRKSGERAITAELR